MVLRHSGFKVSAFKFHVKLNVTFPRRYLRNLSSLTNCCFASQNKDFSRVYGIEKLYNASGREQMSVQPYY